MCLLHLSPRGGATAGDVATAPQTGKRTGRCHARCLIQPIALLQALTDKKTGNDDDTLTP